VSIKRRWRSIWYQLFNLIMISPFRYIHMAKHWKEMYFHSCCIATYPFFVDFISKSILYIGIPINMNQQGVTPVAISRLMKNQDLWVGLGLLQRSSGTPFAAIDFIVLLVPDCHFVALSRGRYRYLWGWCASLFVMSANIKKWQVLASGINTKLIEKEKQWNQCHFDLVCTILWIDQHAELSMGQLWAVVGSWYNNVSNANKPKLQPKSNLTIFLF